MLPVLLNIVYHVLFQYLKLILGNIFKFLKISPMLLNQLHVVLVGVEKCLKIDKFETSINF